MGFALAHPNLRGLCERRAFGRAVLAASRDQTIIDEIAELVRSSESKHEATGGDPD